MWGLVLLVQAVWGKVSLAADGWAGALLPRSSCAYSHLAPYLIYFLPDSLDSNPLHEGTYLAGEISLSALLAKLEFSPMLIFNLCSDSQPHKTFYQEPSRYRKMINNTEMKVRNKDINASTPDQQNFIFHFIINLKFMFQISVWERI